MAGMGKAFYAVGFWIRETGQALDLLGCRLQGNYFFHEQISRHRTLMNIFDKAPHVHREAFVAPSASLIGDVQVGQGSSICYGCVLRASSLNNSRWYMAKSYRSSALTMHYECCKVSPSFIRPTASYSTQASDQNPKEKRKDLSTVEDPFDAPTYNIPEKPVTFAEGASYSLVILVGLGIAAVAGYAVFKELIFEPKEYKIFGKALARIQSDSKVKSRIGHPITGYGTESRNRAARQRIPNRVWTDEDGVEHVEVNFYIRGPHGAGKVFSEMFKDNSDRTWKFTSLVVEFLPPNHGHVILESYIPSYTPA